MFFCTLPMALRGNSSTMITRFGILNLVNRPRGAFDTAASDQVGLV
jgi:hypothetical protein